MNACLCLSFPDSMPSFLLSGLPLGRITQSLEVTVQIVEMSTQHMLKKISTEYIS